jgi:hypothetical protein
MFYDYEARGAYKNSCTVFSSERLLSQKRYLISVLICPCYVEYAYAFNSSFICKWCKQSELMCHISSVLKKADFNFCLKWFLQGAKKCFNLSHHKLHFDFSPRWQKVEPEIMMVFSNVYEKTTILLLFLFAFDAWHIWVFGLCCTSFVMWFW